MTTTIRANDFSVYAALGGPFSVAHLVVVAALVWLVGAVSLGFGATLTCRESGPGVQR